MIYCTLQVEGTHFWAECPFGEVAYLKDPHRHVFHIKAFKFVDHADRDIEFIMLKHRIKEHLGSHYYNYFLKLHEFGGMSCEMIGEELINEFGLCQVEVSEDGENGAVLVVEK